MPSRVKTGLGCRQGLRLQFQVFRVSDRLLESSSLPLRVCTNRMLESGASGRGPKSGTQMAACGSLITVITTRPNLHPPPLGFWIAYCLWLLGLSTVCFACDHFFFLLSFVLLLSFLFSMMPKADYTTIHSWWVQRVHKWTQDLGMLPGTTFNLLNRIDSLEAASSTHTHSHTRLQWKKLLSTG